MSWAKKCFQVDKNAPVQTKGFPFYHGQISTSLKKLHKIKHSNNNRNIFTARNARNQICPEIFVEWPFPELGAISMHPMSLQRITSRIFKILAPRQNETFCWVWANWHKSTHRHCCEKPLDFQQQNVHLISRNFVSYLPFICLITLFFPLFWAVRRLPRSNGILKMFLKYSHNFPNNLLKFKQCDHESKQAKKKHCRQKQQQWKRRYKK